LKKLADTLQQIENDNFVPLFDAMYLAGSLAEAGKIIPRNQMWGERKCEFYEEIIKVVDSWITLMEAESLFEGTCLEKTLDDVFYDTGFTSLWSYAEESLINSMGTDAAKQWLIDRKEFDAKVDKFLLDDNPNMDETIDPPIWKGNK
jgi:hypothetical protein